MSPIIDLAGARRRRQFPPTLAGRQIRLTGSDRLRPVLDVAYERLGPPRAPTLMPDELREWLRSWADAHAWDHARLHGFIVEYGAGVTATLDGVQHDRDARHLLAPELVLALLGVDTDPHSLRACWPQTRDVRELLVLADLFGRPYSG